jgi:hypothetical protein
MSYQLRNYLIVASTKYSFIVKTENIKPHLDIENDIKKQLNGLFSCTLRINQGHICDYVNYRNCVTSEYNPFFSVAEAECSFTRSD